MNDKERNNCIVSWLKLQANGEDVDADVEVNRKLVTSRRQIFKWYVIHLLIMDALSKLISIAPCAVPDGDFKFVFQFRNYSMMDVDDRSFCS